jgi:hypothetical protein
MGMEIIGRNPTSARGRYFRNSASAWHSLADYCQKLAPEITSACRYWHSNDYDGLDAVGALALAEVLQKEINAHRTDVYARIFASEQEMIPEELCEVCGASGVMNRGPHCGAGDPRKGGITCLVCGGVGYVRRGEQHFSTENVAAFAAFLRESGGFEIW